MLGKQDNCQVAVSVSLACEAASVPVAWRLYLPREWADDEARREKAGVPQQIKFETKTAIALRQLEHLLAQGAPRHCVLADAGYGIETAFRERLSALGLPYIVGVTGSVTVWPPEREPLPPLPYSGKGRVPVRLRRGDASRPHKPQSIKELAWNWHRSAGRHVTWREAMNAKLHRALPGCGYARRTAITRAVSCANRNGCSSSGPKATTSR
jgi:SRSO17 transposase